MSDVSISEGSAHDVILKRKLIVNIHKEKLDSTKSRVFMDCLKDI